MQSNAESNHTEVELLRDKNTKFIASLARHQETIAKLQEVVFLVFLVSIISKIIFDAISNFYGVKNAIVFFIPACINDKYVVNLNLYKLMPTHITSNFGL